MDLNELAIFVKVVEEGSFVGASRALGIPKSTVSRKVASLERRLGVRLLERTTRSVRTTEAGTTYHTRCAPLVEGLLDADHAIQTTQRAPTGLLRLTAPRLFGRRFLGPLLIEYLEANPEVRIELLLEDRTVDLVAEGFDLAIRAGVLPDSSLVARRLGPAPLVIVASPAYLEAHGTPTSPGALRHHTTIVSGTGRGPHTWRLAGATVTVRGALVVNSMEVAHQGALAGLGLARLPAFLCSGDLEAGRLVSVLPELIPDRGGLYAVYPSSRHVPAKVRAFVELLTRRVPGATAQDRAR